VSPERGAGSAPDPALRVRDPERIPAGRYVSPEFLAAEHARLWSDVWQLACREDEVARPGDYAEYVVGLRSFLIVRGEDGALRAFHNVCRHRGNLLKTGCGHAGPRLVCDFHRWAYRLDGTLSRISDRETFGALDEREYGLKPAVAGVWGGWVFVHPSPATAPPLLEFLAPLPELLAPFHLEELVPVDLHVSTDVSANWKVAIESFIEVYHVHAIHPQLLPNGDDVNTRFEHWTHHSRMIRPYGIPSPRLAARGGVDPEEILASIFGPAPASGAPAAAADPSLRPDAREAWALVEPYRRDGRIVLPEGVTIRGILREHYERASRTKGVDFSGLDADQFVDNSQFLLFPNVVVNVNPSAVLLFRLLPDARDPNRCRWDMAKYDWVADAESARARRAEKRTIGEQAESLGALLDQDVVQMRRVQSGLQSGALDFLTLSSQERRIAHFNQSIDRYLWSA